MKAAFAIPTETRRFRLIRKVDTRVDVYRDGAKVTELSPIGTVAIRMQRGRTIKTSMSGTFRPNPLVDWLRDELRPVAVINGEEHHVGVFLAASYQESREDGAKSISVSAYDNCWRCQTVVLRSALEVNYTQNIVSKVQELLKMCGITQISAVDCGDSYPFIYEWPMGTNMLTVINESLAMINYDELSFDGDGTAIIQPRVDAAEENVKHQYSASNPDSLLLPRVSKTADYFEAPNVFIVYVSNPEQNLTPVTVVNNYVNSPVSVPRRGREIAKLVRVDSASSQLMLRAKAMSIMLESAQASETIEFSTALQPGHGVGDICSIIADGISGIGREVEWRMELTAGGEMTHKIERAI